MPNKFELTNNTCCDEATPPVAETHLNLNFVADEQEAVDQEEDTDEKQTNSTQANKIVKYEFQNSQLVLREERSAASSPTKSIKFEQFDEFQMTNMNPHLSDKQKDVADNSMTQIKIQVNLT